MYEEKRKPKGIPGRRSQNMLFLVVGLFAGIILAAGAFWAASRQMAAPFVPTPVPLPGTMLPIPTYVPTVPGTLDAPNFMPQPTVIAKRLTALGIAPDGKRILAAGWDNGNAFARLHEFSVTGNLVGYEQELIVPNGYLNNASFSPDGTMLALSDDGYNVWLYAVGGALDAPKTEIEHFTGYGAVAFSSDGKYIALGGNSGLRLLDVATMSLINSTQFDGTITTLAFSPDNQRLALGLVKADTARVLVVETYNPTQIHYDYYSGGYVFDLAFHPEGTALAAGIDSMIQVMDMQIGGSYAYTLENLGRVRSVAFNPQGTWLVAAGGETGGGMMGSIYSWAWSPAMTTGIDTGWYNYRVLGGHAHDVTQVSFLPDGTYLLSASHDGSIRMWDYLNTGYEISRLQM